jgi:hypothetical protein
VCVYISQGDLQLETILKGQWRLKVFTKNIEFTLEWLIPGGSILKILMA